MARYYYKNNIEAFIKEDNQKILGQLVDAHEFNLEEQQRNAWNSEIILLKNRLQNVNGVIIFEYSIPRMGKRIDCVILSGDVIFALEFKVGASSYDSYAIDQVLDYALDLKNFHEQSHEQPIVPILISTEAKDVECSLEFFEDDVAKPILSNGASLQNIIDMAVKARTKLPIDPDIWLNSIYKPTPTIVEAAQALYRGHKVEEISRSDAGAINLSKTALAITNIIRDSKRYSKKSICFLTGVPGSGKTLAGLNLATSLHNPLDQADSEGAVFISGNGPLVEVLREALARDEVSTKLSQGEIIKKSRALSKAKTFIQNIHHFRDDALESQNAPVEKVVIFDEAQRAWTSTQLASFMKTKKGRIGFIQSEPEFLIDVMDRHQDWAVIVCLVGGGQEINIGEAGLHEWFDSLGRSFPDWNIYVSDKLKDIEYTKGRVLFDLTDPESKNININGDLHLAVSVRSYRSENVSAFIKAVLDVKVQRPNCIKISKISFRYY